MESVISYLCEFIVSLRCSLDSSISRGKVSLLITGEGLELIPWVCLLQNSSRVLLVGFFFFPWNFRLRRRSQFFDLCVYTKTTLGVQWCWTAVRFKNLSVIVRKCCKSVLSLKAIFLEIIIFCLTYWESVVNKLFFSLLTSLKA